MPRIFDDELNPSTVYESYFRTYVERDVRQLITLRDVGLFETFVRLLAGRVGQLVNQERLGNDVGVSRTTISEWLGILEASFVTFRLTPYFENFGKRLVKTPKIYFTEPVLAAWLLGIEGADQAIRDPLHGNLFENMVIVDALKERLNQGRDPGLYFWRDSHGNEIDLIWSKQRRLIPIEIKSATTWHREFSGGIRKFQKAVPVAEPGYVIYGGDVEPSGDGYKARNFSKMAEIFGNTSVNNE